MLMVTAGVSLPEEASWLAVNSENDRHAWHATHKSPDESTAPPAFTPTELLTI